MRPRAACHPRRQRPLDARRVVAVHGGRHRVHSGGRARRVVPAVREHHPGPDGRARRQRVFRVLAVRDQYGRRSGRGRGLRPAFAVGHDGGRHRSPELRPVHRHRRLVRRTGLHHAVRITNAVHGSRAFKRDVRLVVRSEWYLVAFVFHISS